MRNFIAPEVDYDAPQHVRDAVASLGRTEDIKFSPGNRRLAVAGFLENKVSVFDVSIARSGNSKSIALTGVAEISSSFLNQPHGVDFIDEETIVVANRYGQPCVYKLPIGATGRHELDPLAVIESDDISSPRSVAVIRNEWGELNQNVGILLGKVEAAVEREFHGHEWSLETGSKRSVV